MKDTVVIDLDGTLANVDHRTHFVRQDKPDWDGFYGACKDDTPNTWCIHLMDGMSGADFKVIIVSARRQTEATATNDWLKKYLVNYDEIVLLRESNNHEEDTVLKKRWLDSYGKDRILFVVDDRQKVVDMWRKEGLVCLQCYAWPEYKKP